MAQNPTPSHLDPGQIIKRVYDESEDRLRVETSATVVAGAMEVSIDQAEDSITVYGSDGSTNRKLKTDSNGELQVDVLSSALPSGASTASKQDDQTSILQNIDTKLTAPLSVTGPLTDTQLRATAVPVSISGTVPVSGSVSVSNFPATQPVSASSLPLPTGASTSALQTTGNSSLSSIDAKIPALGQALAASSVPVVLTAAQLSTLTPLSTVTANLGTLNGAATAANQITAQTSLSSIDSKLTSPITVTGGLTDTQLRASAVPVSAASLPLPTGAATSANQTSTNTKLDTLITQTDGVEASLSSIDSKLTSPLTVTGPLTDSQLRASAVPVSASSLPLPTGAATETTLSSLNSKVTAVNTGAVVVSSSALPTGASTATKQDTGNTSLSSIDTKTPSLGQAVMAASTPVVIASNQSSIPVSQSGTWTNTVTQATGSNLHTVVDSGSITISNSSGVSAVNIQDGGNSITVDGTIASTQSGTWDINNITGTVSLPTGASTSALQTTGNTSLSSIDTKLSSQATATKQDTGNTSLSSIDTKLSSQATAANQTTGNSSLSSIDTKLTSQATAANQTTGNSSLSSIDTKLSTTNTEIGSLTETAPASDTASSGLNGRLQRVAQNITSSNTKLDTLHTDFGVVEGKQDTGNASLSSIDTKLTSQATAANQTTGNSSLASIDTKLSTSNTNTGSIDTKLTSGAQKSQIVDGSGNVVGPLQTVGGTNYAPVVLAASATPGAAIVARSVQVAGSDGTNAQTLSTDNTGKVNVNNISGTVSLPTGASTSALQTTGNSSLSSIDTKLSSQATAANQTTGNSSLSSIDGKLVDNYGVATGALRTAAQLGNTTGQADFNSGTTGAQTVRVSSNITRNGTELSYNSGNSDANTLRTVIATDQSSIKTLPQNTLITLPYDYIAVTYPTTSSEQFVFKTGGVAGTTVGTVLVTYTSVAKTDLLSVSKT